MEKYCSQVHFQVKEIACPTRIRSEAETARKILFQLLNLSACLHFTSNSTENTGPLSFDYAMVRSILYFARSCILYANGLCINKDVLKLKKNFSLFVHFCHYFNTTKTKIVCLIAMRLAEMCCELS